MRILNWNQIYETIASTVKNVLSKKELQVEDPEFDRWCDKVVAVLEKAKKDFLTAEIWYNEFMRKYFSLLMMLTAFVLPSCFAEQKSGKEAGVMNTFKSVKMEEGLKMMAGDSGFILLDVRTPEEYSEGHIPGALQLTNETFTKEEAEKLMPDKAKRIYVYCRSGRRSKQASQKLVDFGYADVVEFGGILSYSGPVEK